MANSYWASIGPLLQPPLKPDNNFKHKLEVGEQPIEPNRGAVLSKEYQYHNIHQSSFPHHQLNSTSSHLLGRKPHPPTPAPNNTDPLIPARFFALQTLSSCRGKVSYRIPPRDEPPPLPPPHPRANTIANTRVADSLYRYQVNHYAPRIDTGNGEY